MRLCKGPVVVKTLCASNKGLYSMSSVSDISSCYASTTVLCITQEVQGNSAKNATDDMIQHIPREPIRHIALLNICLHDVPANSKSLTCNAHVAWLFSG